MSPHECIDTQITQDVYCSWVVFVLVCVCVYVCIYRMYIFVPLCVEDFLFVSPLQLRTTREAAKFAVAGAVIGAVSTAAVSWKYSRSPHGKFPSSFPMLVHKY